MKERLVIKEFGPIEHIDLELGKMTILIGEQATGKSTIAKVLAVCRYFSYIADKFENDDDYFSIGLENWGISDYIKPKSSIDFYAEHYDLKCRAKKGNDPWVSASINGLYFFEVKITPKTKEFEKLLIEYKNIKTDRYHLNIPVFFYQDRIGKVLHNPFYIPTERGLQSIFSLGKSSIQNLSDSLFVQFAKLDQISKSFLGDEITIEPLNISFKNFNGDSRIRKLDENEYYSLSKSASGFQSAVPIVLAIKNYSDRKKVKTFIIEEPEINLFPKAQKKLVEFLAESMNKYKHSFLLPTHSPYILSALNNLMYAYKIANEHNASKDVKKIIEERFWVNPSDVNAYFLENGKSKILLDKKEGLINIDELDSVSEIINKTFDELLTVEIEHSKND